MDNTSQMLSTPGEYIRALRRDYGGYLISTGLLAMGNLALLPVITGYLTPAEIGLYSLVEAGTNLGVTLSLLGLKFAYLYHHAHTEAAERPHLLGTVVAISSASALLTGSLLGLLFGSHSLMALFDSTALPMPWLLPLLMLCGSWQTMLHTQRRAERRVALAGCIAILQLAVWLAASSYLVIALDAGLPGLFGGQIIGQCAACLLAFLVRPMPRFAFDPTRIRALVRYGVPLMLGLLLRYSLDSMARFMLAAWAGIALAGDYLIAMRVATLFEGLLALPFFTAWGGLVHHALKQPRAGEILSRVSDAALAASTLLVLLSLCLQPWLFEWLARDPRPDLAALFGMILLSKAIFVVKSPLGGGLLRTGRTGWSVHNNLLALAVFLPLAWPMITYGGATGGAAAIVIATLIALLRQAAESQQHCRQQPHRAAILAALIGLALPFAMAAGLPAQPGAWAGLIVAGIILLRLRGHHTATNPL